MRVKSNGIWLGALAALALAAAAYGADSIVITNPADGAALSSGQVVQITWRNYTTHAVIVRLTWPEHGLQLGQGDDKTEGMLMWRVPKVDDGTYNLVVEDTAGNRSSVGVRIGVTGGAASPPPVYATPNPFDVGAGGPELTFAGAGAGAKATIYDMEGRKVKEVAGEPLVWDGRNERGDVVAGGTYLFVVELASGEKVDGKIAVVK